MRMLRTDLPLKSDNSGRFLVWMIAFIVFMAGLIVAALMLTNTLIQNWQNDLQGSLTVQLPPDDEGNAIDRAELEAELLDYLGGHAGVRSVERIGDSGQQSLLEPWLGQDFTPSDLPLPALYIVVLEESGEHNARATVEALKQDLRIAFPRAELDDHRLWLDEMAAIVIGARFVASLVLLMIAIVVILTVVFVTRTGLSIHKPVIEIIHLIGADNHYIASQFQRHALKVATLGGLLGAASAVLSLIFLNWHLKGNLIEAEWAASSLWASFLMILLLPLIAAWIATMTARITVLRFLEPRQ